MKRIWLPLFLLAALVNLAGVALGHKLLIFTTKPLLMPLLAVWLIVETQDRWLQPLKNMMLAGLAFATLGDTLLLFGDQPMYFMLGLAAFFCTHLCYIGGFLAVRRWNNGFLRAQPWQVLPFAAYAFGLVWSLWPGIPAAMKWPVSMYAVVITIMALSVVNLRKSISTNIYRITFAGALLFMLSDSLVAWDKFGGSEAIHLGVAIMVTYIAGQFLIAMGGRDMILSGSGSADL